MGVRTQPTRFRDFNHAVLCPEHRHWFVERSKYWFQLSAYREFFDDKQIQVLFFDELTASRNKVLRQCEDFLGLEHYQDYTDDIEARNPAPTIRKSCLFRRLVNIPAYRRLHACIPQGIRHRLRSTRMAYVPAAPPPQWNKDTLDTVVEEIRDDMLAFLEYAGKPADYWDLPGKHVAKQA